MYRIKTDIRQYKCETKEKVEKLIRNWVIRPSDLIYTNEKTWEPIGDHPSFVSLFGMLEEQERREPDTVVTREPTKPSAPEPPPELAPAPNEEVTNVKERPSRDGEPEASEELSPASETVADARETDIIEEDEIAATAPPQPLAPPEAPEGVELPSPPDEVTVMTERTLDLLTITDEDEAVARAQKAAKRDVDKDVDKDVDSDAIKDVDKDVDSDAIKDETTTVRERDEVESERESDPDATIVRERDAVVSAEEDEEETTGVRSRDEVEPSPDDGEEGDGLGESSEAEAVAAASIQDETLAASKPRLGRHNLPEEFFATNEIMGPFDRDALVIDELGELSGASEATGKEGPEEDESVDEAWNEIGDDLRVTEELSASGLNAAEEDEVTSVVAERAVDGAPAERTDEDGEEIENEATVSDEEDTLDRDIEEDAEHEEDEEEEEDDEWDDYDDELSASDVASKLFGPPTDHVADPYAIALPFPIAPTASDIELGIEIDPSSRTAKDRAFPYPSAKAKGRVYTKTFDLTPPPPTDRTGMLVASFVVGVLMLIVLLVVVF